MNVKSLLAVLFVLFFFVGSASASVIDTLRAGNWAEISGSSLKAANIFPSKSTTGWTGRKPYGDSTSVMGAWGGGAYDSKRHRLLVWNGGDGDYAGNEIYYFSIDSLIWRRYTNPPTLAQDSSVYSYDVANNPASAFYKGYHADVYGDSTPRSVHTYDGVDYLPVQDKFIKWGGSNYPTGGGHASVFLFDFTTNTWTRKARPNITDTGLYIESMTGYDPVTGHWFATTNGNGVYEYDPAGNTWASRTNNSADSIGPSIGDLTGVVDPVRRKFMVMGGYDGVTPRLYTWDISKTGNLARTLQACTGDTAIMLVRYPGLVYDPVADRIVAYGGGKSVYVLNTSTWVWTRYANAATGSPPQRLDGNGHPFGDMSKFQYIPERNLYIRVDNINNNVWVYKLPVISRIDMKLQTWRSRPYPAQGVGPSPLGSKHMRATVNSDNGRIYFMGGDYSTNNPNGYSASGRQEMYSYGVKDSTWTLEHGYCPVGAESIPQHPDEVGWIYDTKGHKFWMMAGLHNADDGADCTPAQTIPYENFTFNTSTSLWTHRGDVIENPRSGPGDAGFAVYDTTGTAGKVIQFTTDGDLQATVLDLSTKAWTYRKWTSTSVTVNKEYSCWDQSTRTLYVVDSGTSDTGGMYGGPHHRMLKYDAATTNMDTLALVPGGTPKGPAQGHAVWDPINKVVLWLDYCCDSLANTSRMLAYHPATNQWEILGTQLPDGRYAYGNTTVFDPNQNVLIAIGASTPPGGDLSFFMYRYGNGDGAGFTAAGAEEPPPGGDRAPVVVAPATVDGIAGYVMSFRVTASDPDVQAITSTSTSGTAFSGGATWTADADNGGGTFRWATTGGQAGTYSAIFAFSNALTGRDTTSVTIVAEPAGFGGLCGIWAQRGGEGRSTWFKGSPNGFAAAKTYVGTSGYITIFPGCEDQFTVGTLPDSVTVVWEKKGIQEFHVRELGVVARGVEKLRADSLGVSIGGGPQVKKHLMVTVPLDFTLTTKTVEDKTVVVSGAVLGDVVTVGPPTAAITTSVQYTAWVSASATAWSALPSAAVAPSETVPPLPPWRSSASPCWCTPGAAPAKGTAAASASAAGCPGCSAGARAPWVDW